MRDIASSHHQYHPIRGGARRASLLQQSIIVAGLICFGVTAGFTYFLRHRSQHTRTTQKEHPPSEASAIEQSSRTYPGAAVKSTLPIELKKKVTSQWVAAADLDGQAIAAAAERSSVLRKLQATGEDSGTFTSVAKEMTARWLGFARQNELDVRLGNWQCYAGGCYFDFAHDRRVTIERFTSGIISSTDFRTWTGPKMRCGPIPLRDGTVGVTWVFFRSTDAAGGGNPGPQVSAKTFNL